MALSNLFGWNNEEKKQVSTACGTACGAGDKKAACGSACGAGDKKAACGSACGASDK